MVWGLFPVDALPGEEEYYVFRKGTYKVGRKGCDVIVNKDKGVSRIHAEIVVDAMVSLDPIQNKSSTMSSRVRIRDCSKYGTFVNKNIGSKEKVHEFPGKETTLRDGDLVSFGTGNATYRFCSVPLKFFSYSSDKFQGNQLLQDKISSIGACITRSWSLECTHVLVDKSTPLREDLIDAIVAKKPLVLNSWVEFIAEKSICTEIPSYSSYTPTLMLEGVSVKVGDLKSRENCLRGYTFLLEPAHKYKFKDKMGSLLEVAGAKVVSIEGLEDEEDNHVVRVIPAGSTDQFGSSGNLSSLSRVNEMSLLCAALSGHLDPSIIVSAPVLVSSSCSTDETVVADSEPEIETATSVQISSSIHTIVDSKPESEEKSVHISSSIQTVEATKLESKWDSIDHTVAKSETLHAAYFKDRTESITTKKEEIHECGNGNSDIIYSQDLIVRDTNSSKPDNPSTSEPANPSTNSGLPNFKCFRKMMIHPGNSFSSLIPFSQYPYKESEIGNEEVVQSVKEEKKRKQMEAIAEDLFNNEKGKRRGGAVSLHRIFARN